MSFESTNWRDTIVCLICIFLVFLIVIFASKCDDTVKPISTTTEINVDSLIKANDSIKVEIIYIDSIKNEKVQQVINLNNDSTIELFKQLVRE